MYAHVYLYFVPFLAMVLVAYRGEYLGVHCCGLHVHDVYILKYMQYRLMKTKQGQAIEGHKQT